MQNDREKLIELIKEAYCPVMGGFGDEEKVKWLSELDIVYNWEDVADHLIANSVVVQRQGEWIEHIETLAWCEDDVDVFYKCSVCGTHSPDTSPFCPNCGAKMNEVK